ncbi:MAG: DUF1836 domain-containing protein [Clostridia bacterium]|nr:DUF1836 domain-containing protein [Clostridia bacterium]
MNLSKEKLEGVFSEGEKYLKEFSLPAWSDFPSIELYMDQVVALLNEYLGIFIAPKGDMQITSTMVNNYVKLKTIPAPVKKKYSRKHLAYLVMVCILKQTLSMSTISSIIPPDLENEELKRIYNSFVINHSKAYSFVTDQIYDVAKRFLTDEDSTEEKLEDLVLQVAVSANIFKLITDWVTTRTDDNSDE